MSDVVLTALNAISPLMLFLMMRNCYLVLAEHSLTICIHCSIDIIQWSSITNESL